MQGLIQKKYCLIYLVFYTVRVGSRLILVNEEQSPLVLYYFV
jgi:hypothetical protein